MSEKDVREVPAPRVKSVPHARPRGGRDPIPPRPPGEPSTPPPLRERTEPARQLSTDGGFLDLKSLTDDLTLEESDTPFGRTPTNATPAGPQLAHALQQLLEEQGGKKEKAPVVDKRPSGEYSVMDSATPLARVPLARLPSEEEREDFAEDDSSNPPGD